VSHSNLFFTVGERILDDRGRLTGSVAAKLNLLIASVLDEMTVAEYWANTADRALSTDTVWAAADPVTITFSATQNLDFGTFINGKITLTNNTVLQTPTNMKPGQSGCIELIQDGTGSRTMDSTNTAYVWAGGTNGVLSTVAATRDAMFYRVLDDSKILLTLQKALA